MLRVLQCVVGMNRGGLETFTMNVYRNIDREKVQFDFLVSLDGAYDEEIKRLGGHIYKTPFIDRVGPFAYAANLRRFFKAHPEYTVVHIQMDKFGGMVVREAEKCGVPVRIVHSHSIQNEGNILVRAVKNYYGRWQRTATHRLACSTAAAEWMFGRDADKAVIVKNGIDLSIFTPEDHRDPKHFTIGHVGRFDKVKNHTFLLDIFAEVLKKEPRARLRLAGDGPLRPQMEQKAATLGIVEAVEFIGLCTKIPVFMQKLDVFCLPSLHEGLPISLVEAQACGVPCVVANTINQESNITEEMVYLSLQLSPEQWAREVINFKGAERMDKTLVIKAKGYSIQNTASFLETLYVSQKQRQL